MTLGHEFSGVVDALGTGVTDFTVGTPVAVRPFYACGHCARCRVGLAHLCTPVTVLGCGAAGGGLAEHCVMDAGMAFALPAGVTLEQGALVEPMSVSYHGVLRSEVVPGASTLVFGAGPIGIGVLLALRALGVDDVTVVEPSPARRANIEALGASVVLDPGVDDVYSAVMARTGGRGSDVVFECAEVAASYSTALAVAGARSTLVVLAIYEDPVEWNPTQMMINEIQLRGAMGYQDGVYEAVLALMDQGHYPTEGWVEHIPWDALVEEGFHPLRRGERMKLLVDIS